MTIVRTQAELDAALRAGVAVIDIKSLPGVRLYLPSSGSATVSAYGSATVRSSDSVTVRAYDSATVRAYDSATVSAYDSATVRASDSATVSAYGSATVRSSGSVTVRAFGSATVRAYGSATVSAYDSATVRAYDSATVRAYDSVTVRAYDSATVRAYDSATVSAYDSATVRASDSATVSASRHVAVHIHSAHVAINGDGVIIDATDINHTDPAEWCNTNGVTVTRAGYATVYKAVGPDLSSDHGTAYPIGTTVTAPDWQQTDACGNGLHFGPTPHHAHYYRDGDDTRYLACRIKLADAIGITEPGAAKIKAKACRVLHEVDYAGRKVTP